MTYKTILVHLDGRARNAERLDFAFGIAAMFEGHLVGLYAPGVARIPSYALAEAGPTLRELVERRRAEAVRQAQKEFRDAAARRGDAGAEWRISEADPAAAVALNARYADLVIAAQPEPQDEPGVRSLAEEFVLSAGRPVLYLPYAGRFTTVGERVMIAWDAGRESARAVSDALPLLKRAGHVHVVAFRPERSDAAHGEEPGADIAQYLARHGVKVTVSRYDAPDVDVGNQLLSRAFDLSVDLIVMGAWGHSRLREFVLGGVTRTLLESMTVPVLMSH